MELPFHPKMGLFFGLQFIPVSPSQGNWDFGFAPLHHPDALEQSSKWYQRLHPGLCCSGRGFFTHFDVFAALKGFFSLTLVVLLPWEGFFQSLWCFWHHFHMCQEPCPLILPKRPQSFSSLARGHPRAGCSFLPSPCISQLGTPKFGAPQAAAAPTFIPNP